MYMIDQGWWFVPNPLNKFTVSLRNNPKFNADGSLTLYFQNESPGADKEANWLPAPKGDFIAMLRMYWPKDSDPFDLERLVETSGNKEDELAQARPVTKDMPLSPGMVLALSILSPGMAHFVSTNIKGLPCSSFCASTSSHYGRCSLNSKSCGGVGCRVRFRCSLAALFSRLS